MGAVFPVQAEHSEDDPRGRCDAEGDAGPAVHARHVEDDEHEEDGEQAAGEEIEVLRLEAEELHVLPDALVQLVFHTAWGYRKNDLSTVAATIRNTQAPNQLPAVLPVSGSPDENLEYTRIAPISPQSAPAA